MVSSNSNSGNEETPVPPIIANDICRVLSEKFKQSTGYISQLFCAKILLGLVRLENSDWNLTGIARRFIALKELFTGGNPPVSAV